MMKHIEKDLKRELNIRRHRMTKADYMKPVKETSHNEKAMRTVALRTILALLDKEYGYDKLKEEVVEQKYLPDISF